VPWLKVRPGPVRGPLVVEVIHCQPLESRQIPAGQPVYIFVELIAGQRQIRLGIAHDCTQAGERTVGTGRIGGHSDSACEQVCQKRNDIIYAGRERQQHPLPFAGTLLKPGCNGAALAIQFVKRDLRFASLLAFQVSVRNFFTMAVRPVIDEINPAFKFNVMCSWYHFQLPWPLVQALLVTFHAFPGTTECTLSGVEL
jgi:hypothetical protein